MSAAGPGVYPKHRRAIPSFVETIDSPESGVEVWIAWLDSISADDMYELNASLDSAEQTRAARFHFERDRQHFIATRGILRRLLAAAQEISARDLVFEYGPHGKPAVFAGDAGPQNMHFNVSHANGAAMFALAREREVGIDLETGTRLKGDAERLSDLAVRILSPRELAVWRALPDDASRAGAFLRAWTRKEAYVKATGTGLGDKLNEIEVALDAANPERSMKIADHWMLYDLPSPRGFAAALAIATVAR